MIMATMHCESQQVVLEDMQHKTFERNGMETACSEQSSQECNLAEDSTDSIKTLEALEKGFMQYG